MFERQSPRTWQPEPVKQVTLEVDTNPYWWNLEIATQWCEQRDIPVSSLVVSEFQNTLLLQETDEWVYD